MKNYFHHILLYITCFSTWGILKSVFILSVDSFVPPDARRALVFSWIHAKSDY